MNLEKLITDDVTFQCRSDISTLIVRWQRECDLKSLKLTYGQLLETAEENKMHKWLLDTRHRNKPNLELNLWLRDVFLAKVLPTLGHSVRIAYLITPSRAAKVKETERIDPAKIGTITKWFSYFDCIVDTFMTESDAYEWLNVLDR